MDKKMNDKKIHWKAICQDCGHEWIIKEFKPRISCPECGETEFIEVRDQDED